MIEEGRTFVYGTHYWRPPTPLRDTHERNLAHIKHDLGFDLVKFRMLWNWHHREPERFAFDEVHEMFDICDRIGLAVLIEVNLESAPYWLERVHPEARYVNANGRAIELGSQEATPGGGHPGLCFHHPTVVEEAQRYLVRLVDEFKGRPSLYAYDCWNEPHLEPAWCNMMWGNTGDFTFCYCDGSRREFRQWLQGVYGEIDVFNEAWGRAYTDFEQVSPPILQGNYADWLDWFRFWFDSLAENMAWRVRTIKGRDPNRQVISHSGAVPPVLPRAGAVIHNWKFAEPVDKWGTSFAPQAFGWPLSTCAMVAEVTRGAARGKDFWISEMPGGASNIRGFRRSWPPQPEHYRLWNWLTAAHGSRGTMHWSYLPERTGQEAGGYGMMRPDGTDNPRSLAIAETARRLKRHEDVIMGWTPPTQVAVLYDPDISSLLFAMELTDERYGKTHTGYYRAIWSADLLARYLTPETLDDVREPVLIAPMMLVMDDATAEKLARYVRDGGTLILETRTGLFDRHGYMRATLPAGALAEAAGVVEGEAVCSDPENQPTVPTADGRILVDPDADLPDLDPISLGPPIAFSEPVKTSVRAHGYLAPLELRGARPIAAWGSLTLGAHHAYGRGQVYTIGTYLGLAMDKRIAEAVDLVRTILLRHARPVVRGNRLRPRMIGDGERAILAVFNDHRREAVTEAVPVPERYMMATDVYTREAVAVVDQAVELTVPAEDCRVLLLER